MMYYKKIYFTRRDSLCTNIRREQRVVREFYSTHWLAFCRYENGEEEHCLELWNRDGKGLKWNDSPCSFETFFVCEVQWSIRGTGRREWTARKSIRGASPGRSSSRRLCAWRFSSVVSSFVSVDLTRQRDLTWRVRSDWKWRAISRSLPSSRSAAGIRGHARQNDIRFTAGSFRKRITGRRAKRRMDPQCRRTALNAIHSSSAQRWL